MILHLSGENATNTSRNYSAQAIVIHPFFRINVADNILENDMGLIQVIDKFVFLLLYSKNVRIG